MTPRTLVCLAALTGCGARGPVALWEGEVRLPVEVLGAAGAERTVRVTVTPERAPFARWLELRVHGVDARGMASVAINDLPAVALDDPTVVVAEPGRSYGGIGGGFATLDLRLPLPPGALAEGENRLRFRFTDTGALSIGYRVLRIGVADAAGQSVAREGQFGADDPALWRAPRPAADDVAAGAALWSSAPLTRAAAGGRRPITAACGDCHTRDGRDLQYFAYSNLAIVEASRAFGLSQADGERIASYIRSLPVTPHGRPWNPPYQPGSELDARPLAAWAAGAGVDAVLPDDRGGIDHLFAGGITRARIATTGRLNARELPIPVQLPDWNRWLPPEHPRDLWGDEWTNHDVTKRFARLRDGLTAGGKSYAMGAMPGDLNEWANALNSNFIATRAAGGVRSRALAEALYATKRWRAVKLWELMQEFGLEDVGAALYAPTGEPRTWFGLSGIVFNTAPESLTGGDAVAVEGSALVHRYLAAAWHYLQLLLNPGNRRRLGWSPVVFYEGVRNFPELADLTGAADLTRTLVFTTKGFQEMDNGIGPGDPLRGWSFGGLVTWYPLVGSRAERLFANVPPATRRQIVEAVVGAWWDATSRFPDDAWKRGSDDVELAPREYRPTVDRPSSSSADEFYRAIPRLRALGVDAALVDALVAWGARTWPQGDWAALRP